MTEPDNGLELRQLLAMIWSGRVVTMMITPTRIVVAGADAFLATDWYQADVVLSPVGSKSLPGGLD